MKRYHAAVLTLAVLCLSACSRTDISQGVRIYRPVALNVHTVLPLSETAAALRIALATSATDLEEINYDTQIPTPLSASVSHQLGTVSGYRWFLNGVVLPNQTTAAASLDVLQAGTYELAVEASTAEFKYVQQIQFRIR